MLISKFPLLARACISHTEAPTAALSIPGPPGWSAIRMLRNGAVVHYGASIAGVNWAGSHARLFFSVWCKLQVKAILHLSSFLSICFPMFYDHLTATCRVSTSEKTSYWKSMACNLGTFPPLWNGTCSQTCAIGPFQIECSCSVFGPNYMRTLGKMEEEAYLFIIV